MDLNGGAESPMKSSWTNIENAQAPVGQSSTRHPKSQEAEALIGCNILNRMITLGRPESFAIGA